MDLKELTGIATQALAQHGLADWSFGFSRARRRLGVCRYAQKRIEISAYYALHSPVESVMDTLWHEIAHALAGPAARHGPRWKAIARRLGATPRARDVSRLSVLPPGRWQATCSACAHTHQRDRRPLRTVSYRCRCSGRGELHWRRVSP